MITRYVPLSLLVFGVVIRLCNQFGESRLWSDEMFSVGVAESPAIDGFLATLRFDAHPPLYYLQLHIWQLFGHSDFWFLLNSLVWSLVSIWVMYRTVKALYGEETGLWAAAIFAVLPLEIFFAENVRMYTFVAVFQILLWGQLETQLRAQAVTLRSYLLAAVIAAVITLSHGLGFFVVFVCFLQAGIREFMARGLSRMIPLALSYVPAGLCTLWPLVIGSFRQTVGATGFNLGEIGTHVTLTVLGLEFPVPALAGFIAFTVIILLCFSEPRARAQLAWLVLLPFALLLFLNLAVKPVLIYRTMGLFLPYLAIALGLSAQRIFAGSEAVPRVALATLLLIMVASGINYTVSFEKEGYRTAVNELDRTAAPNSLILAHDPSDFWALQRYLNKDGTRFSALDVQPPVRGGLQRLKERLESTPLGRYGFFGRADRREIGGRTLAPVATTELLTGRDVVWVLNPQNDCDEVNEVLKESAPDGAKLFAASERISAEAQTILACRLPSTEAPS